MTVSYPLPALRALALHTQGLTTPNGKEPTATREQIDRTADQLVAIQIDTLQVVQRSHYLILWSRLGTYNTDDFDALSYAEPRKWFEGWFHAACYIPLREYRFRLPRMNILRENPPSWIMRRLEEGGETLIEHVHQRIRDEGALMVADFKDERPDEEKAGSWWNWKPAKTALEHLYACGDLMIANRMNFHRVYDLRERVLPGWVDTTDTTHEEMVRYYTGRLVKSYGACETDAVFGRDVRVKKAEIRTAAQELIADGTLVEIEAKLTDGETHTLLVHKDNLPLLEQAADGALPAERTTFINFFDSVFWPTDRDKLFWNYSNIIEAYKPEDQRIYGYYCQTIQHKDRMVGRFDPRLDRATGTLYLKALYLEPGVEPEDELVQAVAETMKDYLAFHEAADLVIEKSEPVEFAHKLLAAL